MALLKVTSPHTHGPLQTSRVMQFVLLATLPGIAALTVFFGWGTIVNLAVAIPLALLFEAIAIKLRGRPVLPYLSDYSALVTATLLAIAIPPYAPFWLIAVGIFCAIILAKQLYGGLGYNPFNPAMVAYVILLISFPVAMTSWAAPLGAFDGNFPSFISALKTCFQGTEHFDGITMATPLDIAKQNTILPFNELWRDYPQFGKLGGLGWEWVNLGFLLGGLFLLWRGIFTWHAPISMLVSLSLTASIFYLIDPVNNASPLFHLFSGATMFGAFFIITDPVSSAVSNKGRIVFGALIGLLIYLIRSYGNYPDAVAFAVLLMNFSAPFIDHYTKPRTYGYGKGGK